jgi:hypothetical protein
MSEYQYYEFQAIDRTLDERQMRALRRLSSRATITPTWFQNTYHSGDFKGDPAALIAKYFDVFVYVANWGRRELMLGLPRRALDMSLVASCCAGDGVSMARAGRDRVVVTFTRDAEEDGDWDDDGEGGEGWLPSLVPLRTDLLRGDLRVLYLAWLRRAQCGELDDDAVEPPPPAGLRKLSAPLERFVDFMRIDQGLIDVAAERSQPETAIPARELAAWISGLATKEKDRMLMKVVRGEATDVSVELGRRFERERSRRKAVRRLPARTVGELLSRAER